MSLSPLKTAGAASYRRRGSFPWTGFLLALAGLALALLAYHSFFSRHAALLKAFKAWQAGQTEVAEAQLLALQAQDPADPGAVDGLGLIANTRGDQAKAAEAYSRALALGLTEGKALDHAKAGQVFISRGDYKPALAEFRHALQLDPKDPAIQLGLGQSLQATGDFAGSVDAYQKALAANPKDLAAQKGLENATRAKEQGALYFIYDRNRQPLARRTLQPDGSWAASYPLEQFTAHVVGCEVPEQGKTGVEKAMGSLFPGNEVVLTLDAKVQRIADKALGWKKGALVVVDPATGEILAAVNHPSYNPNTLAKDWKKVRANKNLPLKDRALGSLYEPGSICKIITAAAALETHVDMTAIFPVNADHPLVLNGQTFWDWKKLGKIRSLKDALDVSSNIALAKVGFALGADQMHEWTNRFGFGTPEDLGIDMPGGKRLVVDAATSLAPLPADNQFALAERACGLGEDYRITPLRAAMLAAAVANHGILMRPRLIKEVRNIAGVAIASSSPQVFRQVMSPETAEKLKDYMIDTTERGIGRKAKVAGVLVAGKTGTARTNKKQKDLDAWFICFAPADKPQIAIAVLAEDEGKGMEVAAPIARSVIQDLIQ